MGYKYTGPGNLYGLTLIEVDRLTRGGIERTVRSAGFSDVEMDRFARFREERGL